MVESGKYDLNSNSDTEKDDKPDIQNGESQSLLKKDTPATTTSKNDPIVIVSKGCILSNYNIKQTIKQQLLQRVCCKNDHHASNKSSTLGICTF